MFADGRADGSSYGGLVGACVGARTSALDRPGVTFTVERTNAPAELARYRSERGKLVEAWVR